ncbi:cobW-domain-containing protein [Amylocystis lapponica]|nr:cobW-domain-containing protein [Amylocystis lapponica]
MDSDDDAPTLLEVEPTEEAIQPGAEAVTVPLTIICGFLGAGKSTLVKRILTERHGYRIAVIMNEFGDTADIEAKAINVSSAEDPTQQSEEFLELANGCLCCSIKDSGIAAIEKLMQRKGGFDYILLETTGLADPGPIASMFWQNEEYAMGLGKDIHLDGVVCVVDAVFGRKQMEEDHAVDGAGESIRQIASADVILLNKVDLVPPSELEATEDVIRNINPAASLYQTVKGELDLKFIVGIDAYTSRPLLQNTLHPTTAQDKHDHDHSDPNHTHDREPTHYEIRGISSLQVACPTMTSSQLSLLDEWIRTVLWEGRLPGVRSADVLDLEVLRCKGMFTTDSGKIYVLQGVRNIYEMTQVEGAVASGSGLPDMGKLVFIGKGLNDAVRCSLVDILKQQTVSK